MNVCVKIKANIWNWRWIDTNIVIWRLKEKKKQLMS